MTLVLGHSSGDFSSVKPATHTKKKMDGKQIQINSFKYVPAIMKVFSIYHILKYIRCSAISSQVLFYNCNRGWTPSISCLTEEVSKKYIFVLLFRFGLVLFFKLILVAWSHLVEFEDSARVSCF